MSMETASRHKCRHCGADDVVGPFEMDGYRNGEHRSDWRWIVCRRCNRHTAA